MAFKFLSSLVYVHCNDSEILRVDIYTCVFAFHRTYTCICWIYMYKYMYLYVIIYTYIYICAHIYILYICIHICMHIRVYIYIFVYTHMHIFQYAYICRVCIVCVCMCVCVLKRDVYTCGQEFGGALLVNMWWCVARGVLLVNMWCCVARGVLLVLPRSVARHVQTHPSCVMSRTSMSCITCMNASYHADVRWVEWDRHMHEIRHASMYMNELCHAHEWVMSRTWMSHVAHMNVSCSAHAIVMRKPSRTRMSYERVMPHTCHTHATHMPHTCHTHRMSDTEPGRRR